MRTILIIIFLGLYGIVTLPLLLAIYIIGFFSKKKQYAWCKGFTACLCRGIMFLTGSTIDITGYENIPDETVLFVGNHRSIFDIVTLLFIINRPFGFVGKAEVTKWPYVNMVLSMLGGLFIDRSDNRKALKTILEGIALLKSGHSLLIFPEGTRNKKSTEPLPFKQGSLKLADKANVPIVPFSIRGTDDVFENNSFLNIKRSNIKVNFGKPVLLSTLASEDRKKSGSYVRDLVIQLLHK
ncbi:1-acyl-sn-glycerol-3-phosphate acyltransferase [Vallitalea pronyensis]|uniref:1-acyl-sn-glycerol-3-phosphate acyltransferase n=1 Tax=Vallitalea pronyensis TaxID=1348613 RepID=A0A8J8MGZ9_9FIRM|nr:lysophospholipid acyltransferase family protein [Vallitalea pronyensis]QUI21414.1 1-acyl-sn-glycerol-3-phosphate acyltransferase [Vallitalea pronyensis]